MYTLFRWRPQLMGRELAKEQRIRVGIIGLPGRMCTMRSLLLLLSLFPPGIEEVVVICHPEGVFSEGQQQELAHNGLRLRVASKLNKELHGLDVIY